MLQQWRWIIRAAFIMTIPLAAGAVLGEEQSHSPAAKAVKKAAKPHAKTAKHTAKTAKAAHKMPGPPGMAGMAASHRPPVSAPTPLHSRYEVPQPKSLADTPDMVLNSKVRASLISALTGGAGQDISAETAKGVVTLTGTVKTKQLRARAEQVAQKVHGVRAVKNHLVVK